MFPSLRSVISPFGDNVATELVNNSYENIEFFMETAVEKILVLTVEAYNKRQIRMRTFFECYSETQLPKAIVLKVNGTTEKTYIPHDFVKYKKFEFNIGNDRKLVPTETPR
uniref:Uncharacterized protein n=1 Tax=Fagus sylvatica TaxID=28930 RepID=A0A2N9G2V9_FAGSY